jgi:hypothetical protein
MKKNNEPRKARKKTDSEKAKSQKIVLLETKKLFEELKKEKKKEETLIEDNLEEGVEISSGFSLGLSKRKGIESLDGGKTLEGALIFAPRIGSRGRMTEGKNYSEVKYEKNYSGSKYGDKTPGLYEEKSAPKETPNHGNSNGNQ